MKLTTRISQVRKEARETVAFLCRAIKREPTEEMEHNLVAYWLLQERSKVSVGYARRGKSNEELAKLIATEDRSVAP
jgi:hypothetical protein